MARQILSLHQKRYLLSQPTCHPPPSVPPFTSPSIYTSPAVLLFFVLVLFFLVLLLFLAFLFFPLLLLSRHSLSPANTVRVIRTPLRSVNNRSRTRSGVYMCGQHLCIGRLERMRARKYSPAGQHGVAIYDFPPKMKVYADGRSVCDKCGVFIMLHVLGARTRWPEFWERVQSALGVEGAFEGPLGRLRGAGGTHGHREACVSGT